MTEPTEKLSNQPITSYLGEKMLAHRTKHEMPASHQCHLDYDRNTFQPTHHYASGACFTIFCPKMFQPYIHLDGHHPHQPVPVHLDGHVHEDVEVDELHPIRTFPLHCLQFTIKTASRIMVIVKKKLKSSQNGTRSQFQNSFRFNDGIPKESKRFSGISKGVIFYGFLRGSFQCLKGVH